MTRYLFHGGGFAPDKGVSFYEAILSGLPDTATILVCCFASRASESEDQIAVENVRTKLHSLAPDKRLTVQLAETDRFMEQVYEADVIMLRGGSTEKLIKTLEVYGDLATAFRDKTVTGASAGAYALATWYSSHYEDKAVQGLGIVPVRMITHFEGALMQPKPGAIADLETTAPELPLIKLHEGEWQEFLVD